ncbi:hypothetical protein ACFLUV_07020, partial [Elusimicrobiota bacterium]
KKWRKSHENISLINNIYNGRIIWSARLLTLALALPDGMCIDSLSISKEQKNVNSKIISLTEEGGFEKVKKYMSDIEKTAYFDTGAKLESQKRTRLKDKEVNYINVIFPVAGKNE